MKHGGLYIDFTDWIKKKKATINSKHKDDKCFQYAATVALKHEEIKRDPQRISNIKYFMNNYSWNRIKYQSKIADWKTFEKKKLLSLYCILKKKKYMLLIFQNIIQPVKNK